MNWFAQWFPTYLALLLVVRVLAVLYQVGHLKYYEQLKKLKWI